ncbi:hypothetical protein MMC29_002385 [Sticta canariensis]|nr:hypothetical protein [Sticta canariensis]
MHVPIRASALDDLSSHDPHQLPFAGPHQSHDMPSDQPSKKRKRNHQFLDLGSSLSSQSDPLSPWPLLSPTIVRPSSPLSNHQIPAPHYNPHLPSFFATTTTPSATTKRRRLPLPPRPRFRPSSTPTRSSTTSISQPPNLAPCHICHRRPTAHEDLPGYSSCESCERRTCCICMRVCEGSGCRSNKSTDTTMTTAEYEYDPYHFVKDPTPNTTQHGLESLIGNHSTYFHSNFIEATESVSKGKSICGKCCVEVGAEGKVWCLVCFEDDADDGGGAGDSDDDGDGTGRVQEWLEGCDELIVDQR